MDYNIVVNGKLINSTGRAICTTRIRTNMRVNFMRVSSADMGPIFNQPGINMRETGSLEK